MDATIKITYVKSYPFDEIEGLGDDVSKYYWETLGRFMSTEQFDVVFDKIPVDLVDGENPLGQMKAETPLWPHECKQVGRQYIGVRLVVGGTKGGVYLTIGSSRPGKVIPEHYEVEEEYDASDLWAPRRCVERLVPESREEELVAHVFKLTSQKVETLETTQSEFYWPSTSRDSIYGVIERTFRLSNFRGAEAIGKLVINR